MCTAHLKSPCHPEKDLLQKSLTKPCIFPVIHYFYSEFHKDIEDMLTGDSKMGETVYFILSQNCG